MRRAIWWQIIEDYSSWKMTEKSDKFAALAGITTFFQERFRDTIFAGLSLKDLRYDLFWDTEKVNDRPALQNVPSWSWASIDGPVKRPYAIGRMSHGLEIFDTKGLTWSGEALISWPKGGAIKVRGPLMRTRYLPAKNEVYRILEPLLWSASMLAFILRYLARVAAYLNQSWAESLRQRIPQQRQLGMCILDRHDVNPEDGIWCLEVATGGVSEFRMARPNHTILDDRKEIVWSHVLLVKPAGSGARRIWLSHIQRLFYFVTSWDMLQFGRFEAELGEFRRIGVGWMQEDDWKFQEKTARAVKRTLTIA